MNASAPQLLKDLRIRLVRSDALSIYETAQTEERIISGGRGVLVRDLATVSDHDNLAQAMIIRLLTPRGELAELGHGDFGSRLHELIGQPNTETRRNLAKLYVIEALKQERRIAKIEKVEVKPKPGERQVIEIFIRVLPIGANETIDLGPLGIDLA